VHRDDIVARSNPSLLVQKSGEHIVGSNGVLYETIHDYKLLELSNISLIGSERYAEAMNIALGQQSFRGAFTKKPSMESCPFTPWGLDHLTYVAYGPRSYYIKNTGPGSDGTSPSICA
jgi:hypothetical protein